MTRIAFQAAMRAGCVSLLEAYKAANTGLNLSIYPGRPRRIAPPHAFVDGIHENITYTGLVQRQPRAEVVIVHGLYDSKDTVDQRDAFVDGFLDWCIDNIHAANPNTTVGLVEVQDEPTFVPDWLPAEEQKTYYATRLFLEGLSLSG